LFLAIRLQDDIYDGQATAPLLILAADLFLAEAQSAFSTIFPASSPFWRLYRKYLTTTTRSIIECDELLRSPRTRAQALLQVYASVSAIFKIGAAAVCVYLDRMKDFPLVSRFADTLSEAGQILDDLMDIAEDLERGRQNYAARLLVLPMMNANNKGDIRELIVRRFEKDHQARLVVQSVRRQLRRARRLSQLLDLPEATEYVGWCEESLHGLRVESADVVRRSRSDRVVPQGW
jgi:hypothetical protein